MASIETFEDVKAWKKGRELALSIYRLTGSGKIARDFTLRDQLRRASVSVISNIAEGFERNGDREFAHFPGVAKGSVGEIRAQLLVALDAGLVSRVAFDQVSALAEETGRLLGGFVQYLNGGRHRSRIDRGGAR